MQRKLWWEISLRLDTVIFLNRHMYWVFCNCRSRLKTISPFTDTVDNEKNIYQIFIYQLVGTSRKYQIYQQEIFQLELPSDAKMVEKCC